MTVRMVIEGLDATGKTTVAAGLVDQLGRQGIPVHVGKGLLSRRHAARWLLTRKVLLRRPPHSNLVTGLFLLAYVGYASAGGAHRAARWAVRHAHWFAQWDLAIHPTASHEVRCDRLHRGVPAAVSCPPPTCCPFRTASPRRSTRP